MPLSVAMVDLVDGEEVTEETVIVMGKGRAEEWEKAVTRGCSESGFVKVRICE